MRTPARYFFFKGKAAAAPDLLPVSGRQRGSTGNEGNGGGGEAQEHFSVDKICCACEMWALSSKEMK